MTYSRLAVLDLTRLLIFCVIATTNAAGETLVIDRRQELQGDFAQTAKGAPANDRQKDVLTWLQHQSDNPNDGCGLDDGSGTFKAVTKDQLSTLQDIVDDLDADWLYQTNSSVSWQMLAGNAVGPKAFKRALFHGVFMPVKEILSAAIWKHRYWLNPYFLLSTSCGKFLFMLKPVCKDLDEYREFRMRYSLYEDEDDHYTLPSDEPWKSLYGETFHDRYVNGFSMREGGYHGGSNRNWYKGTIYRLEPVEVFAPTYKNELIAQHLYDRFEQDRLWKIAESRGFAHAITQILPFGSVWNTILDHSFGYPHQAFDLWDDGSSVVVDGALDLMPFVAASRHAKRASKILWGVATTGVVGRVGWQTYSDGKPKLEDILRAIVVSLVAIDVFKSTPADIADDVGRALTNASQLMEKETQGASPEIIGAIRDSVRYVERHVLPQPKATSALEMAQFIAGEAATTWITLWKQRLGKFSDIATQIDAVKPTNLDFHPTIYTSGAGRVLASVGKTLVVNGIESEMLELRITTAFLDEVKRISADPSIGQRTTQLQDFVRKEIESSMQQGALNTGTRTNMYEYDTGKVDLNLMRVKTYLPEGVAHGLDDWQQTIILNEVHDFNKLLVLEESGHALAHFPGDSGFFVGRGIMFPSTHKVFRTSPLTVRSFNFYSWVVSKSEEELKALFHPQTWAIVESRRNYQAKVMGLADPVSAKLSLLSEFAEADIMFTFLAMGLPVTQEFLLRYPIRHLAVQYMKGAMP